MILFCTRITPRAFALSRITVAWCENAAVLAPYPVAVNWFCRTQGTQSGFALATVAAPTSLSLRWDSVRSKLVIADLTLLVAANIDSCVSVGFDTGGAPTLLHIGQLAKVCLLLPTVFAHLVASEADSRCVAVDIDTRFAPAPLLDCRLTVVGIPLLAGFAQFGFPCQFYTYSPWVTIVLNTLSAPAHLCLTRLTKFTNPLVAIFTLRRVNGYWSTGRSALATRRPRARAISAGWWT